MNSPGGFSQHVKDLFNDPTFSDINILLDNDQDDSGGTKTFFGHRVVLATMSDYFRTMLFGPFVEAGQREIQLKGVPYSVFERCMRFVYCGWSHQAMDMTLDEAEQFYTVARMLLIDTRVKQHFCWWFERKFDSWENEILRIVQFAIESDLAPLVTSSIGHFSHIASCCFKMDRFNELPLGALQNIVARKPLNCSRAELKHAVTGWIKANKDHLSSDDKKQLLASVGKFSTACYNGRKITLCTVRRSKRKNPDGVLNLIAKEPPQVLFETPCEYSYSSKMQINTCIQLFGVTLVFQSNQEFGPKYGNVKSVLDVEFTVTCESSCYDPLRCSRAVHVVCDFERQNRSVVDIFFKPVKCCRRQRFIIGVKWKLPGVQPTVLSLGRVDHEYVTMESTHFTNIYCRNVSDSWSGRCDECSNPEDSDSERDSHSSIASSGSTDSTWAAAIPIALALNRHFF